MKAELRFIGVVILIILAQVILFRWTGYVVDFIHGPRADEVESSGAHQGGEPMGYHQVTGPSKGH